MTSVKLAQGIKEEAHYGNLADIFAIVKSIERLEGAYVRDIISSQQYEPACHKLLAQYKTLWNSMRDSVPDVDAFIRRYSMHCPMAASRIKSGVPATIEHGKPNTSEESASRVAVASAVSNFITTMDSIRLGIVAADEISPSLKELLVSLNKLKNLSPDFSAKSTVQGWISKLHMKPAHYEMPDDDKRQLLYELETAYSDLLTALEQ